MAQSGIEAVVFDLGGVLIDWNPRYLYRRLFDGDEARVEAFLAEVCTAEWNAGQDAGRPWAEAIELLALERPAERELIAAYDRHWDEMLGGSIEGTVAILEALRGGPRLFALSNWSAEKFPVAQARYPFLGWFDGVVISGEVGLCKPDARIFRHLLDRFDLAAPATVFIDDSEPNLETARTLGFITIPFEGPSPLGARLRELGVLDGARIAG